MTKITSNLHLEILDKNRQELLQQLLPLTKGFVLGGGTGLSLQLAHRKSFDFDFFSLVPLPKKLLERLSLKIKIDNIVVDNPDELTFFTNDAIKCTFLCYPFKPYFKDFILEEGLSLFSVQEIALQKAYTIGRRGEYRDYFDLYAILKDGYINLDKIISKAKKVYGGVFDEKIFLEQLVYFDDLSNFEIIKAEKPIPSKEEVKVYFKKLVKQYL